MDKSSQLSLYETIPVTRQSLTGAIPSRSWSASSSVSPDRSRLAFVDGPGHDVLYVIDLSKWQEGKDSRHLIFQFSASLPPCNTSKGNERLSAPCWTLDSASVVIIGQDTGSVFLLDCLCKLTFAHLPEKLPFPWRGDVSALATPCPDRVLIATRSKGNLYLIPLPLPLPPGVIVGPPPPSLNSNSLSPIASMSKSCQECRSIQAMSFDASSSFLAVVGEGGQGNGYAVISLWSCFISKGSNDVMIRSHLRFPRPVSSNVLPIHQDQQWSISFSPTSGSERLTVSAASPCSPGLLIAHASEGKLVNARRTTSRSMASSPRKGIREEGVDNETCCDWWSASSLIVGRNDGQVSIVDVATDQVLFSSIFSSGLRVWRMNHSTSSGGHLVPCALILEPCLDGWKLSAMIERTPEEMMVILANKGEWEETLQIAETYNLDRDEVYRLKWKSQRVDAASIASCLSLIVDKGWVVEECATCVAEDPQVQSILISHGLDLTESYCLGTEGLQIHDAHIGWWRRMRLLLLRHKDRLDTYLIMQSKSPGWDVEAFASFRDSDMISVAKELAGCGDVSRLSALIQRHSRILGPFLLDILDQVPESLDPRLYAQLLPKADGLCSVPVDSTLRAPDWIESKETADQLMQDDFFDSLSTATEQMHQASIAGGYEPHLKGLPTPADVTSWYCRRTCEIDALSGQIHNSILLLEAATQRGVTSDELLSLLMQARSLSRLLSSSDPSPLSTSSWEMSLDCFHTLEAHEQLLLMLSYGSVLASRAEDEHDCEEEDYDEEWIERVVGDKRIESEAMELSLAIKEHGYPFLSSVPGLDRASLLLSLCKTQLESRPSWLRTLVWAEARRISLTTHQGLFSSSLDLAKTVETCIRDSAIHGDPDILMQCLACCIWSLDQLGSDDESKEPRDSIKSLLLLLRAGKVMEKRGVPGALLSPFALSNGQRAASEQILDALLSDSSRASWKERDWRLLWADVDLLCTHGALPGISAQEAFSEMLRSVLDCGQTSLAASLISASQQMGGRSIMDGALVRPPKLEDDRLINIIADTASRLLTTSPSLDDQDTTSAAELLSLLPEPLLNVPRPLPPALRLLRALPRIKKLLDIVPSPQNYDDLVPVCLVEDIAKGGPELLVQRMLDVFSSSTGARLHRQVDELVDVALAVGSSDQSSEEEVRSSILFLAASAATSAGDLKAGLSLTLKLASLRYSPAATLAATLGMEQPDEGSDQETRFKLLSFAASHCDTGALPQLLEELAAVGTRRIEAQGLASEPPIDPTSPSALLAHALPLLQHVPTRGWWELMVATLLQPLADDATSFVLSHLSDKSYSDTQRLIYAGIFANSLRAFFCLDSLSSIDEIRQVCCLSPSDITSSAKKMLISASSDNLSPKLKEVARDCLQAADSLLLHLKGVEDGRSVRLSLGPLANQSGSEASAASAFVSGDKTTVRAAILQQARRAGQQVMVELEEHGTAEASMKVLGESIALGLSYDAAEEVECRSEYLMTLIQTCKQSDGPLPAHMRSQALGQVDTMLAIQENSSEKTAALLAHSLALNVWTKIPPSSHHHISTILLTLSKCAASLSIKENSLGKDLDKVVILIDKAWGSGSLKGLDARSILTPLLRPHITSCLSPLINMQAGQEILMPDTSHDHSSGLLSLGDEKDDTLQSLSVEAQAAVFSFSTSPSSAASASKLLKVLQSLLPPSRATSALPPSLPYLSLLLQATTTNTNGGTLDYAAWAIAAPCLDKLTVPQIRSWADFVLLSSGKQPLPSKATNGKRHPLSITDPFLKLTALESCIPKLAAEKQANEAIVECHSCLYAQYKTLRVWHALESCIRSNKDLSLSRQLEAASRIDLASDEKCSEVMADAVTELVEGGHPLRLIIALVADASRRGPVVEPNSPPLPSLDGFLDQSHGDSAAFIARTISNAAKARLVGLFSSSTLDHHSSLTKIHSIALCLQDGFEADGLVLSARNDFWLQVRTKIDNLDASSYSNESSAATVLRLLDLQSLLPKIWPGWNPPSSVGQPGLELDPLGGDETAVLLGRTRLILGGGSLWPHLTLTAIEVGSREAASDLFKSLLAPPLTHDKVERLEQLLAETWAEGKVWKLEKGDDTEGPCSLLHELWRDLALATLSTDSHLAQFAIKVVDRVRHQARCGQIASLSSQDVATLIKASEDKPILHACISFLSPYPPQSLTMALDQHLEPFSEIQLLCLLCAILLPFSQDHSLDPQPIMLLTHKNLWGGIIRSLEYVPLSSSNPLSSLFPTLASALILTGQTSYAAQLTSLKLRLHPSLASLSGGLAFLKSTLKDSLVASSGRHALSRNKSGPGHLLFSIVPHSLDSIQVGVGDICRRALDQFNA